MFGIIKPLARAIFNEIDSQALITRALEAFTERLQKNETIGEYLGKINTVTDAVVTHFDGMGYKGVLLKNLVVAQLTDMAKDNPEIEKGLTYGDQFLKLVLSKLTVDSLMQVITPAIRMVAIAAVRELNEAVDGDEV
ncbi:MAG: hypothetical protein AAF329_18880 [Cyanobacteria bacterium P01_A01_bin.17]